MRYAAEDAVDLSGEFQPLLDAVLVDLGDDFEADIAAESVARSIGAAFSRTGTTLEVRNRKKWWSEIAVVGRDYRPGRHLSIHSIVWW